MDGDKEFVELGSSMLLKLQERNGNLLRAKAGLPFPLEALRV